jgi:hypothetical protein
MCGAEGSLLLRFPTLDGTLECAGKGGFPLWPLGIGGALLPLLFKVLTPSFVLSRRIQNLQRPQNKATSLAHSSANPTPARVICSLDNNPNSTPLRETPPISIPPVPEECVILVGVTALHREQQRHSILTIQLIFALLARLARTNPTQWLDCVQRIPPVLRSRCVIYTILHLRLPPIQDYRGAEQVGVICTGPTHYSQFWRTVRQARMHENQWTSAETGI